MITVNFETPSLVRLACIVSLLGLLPVPAALAQWQAVPQSMEACEAVQTGEGQLVTFATRTGQGEELTIEGLLMRPEGTGPFPAIVMLHGGWGPRPPFCLMVQQRMLVAWGYAALLIDSFSAQHPDRRGFFRPIVEDWGWDARRGKAFLARLPFIDAGKIGVVGWSRGGGAAIAAVSQINLAATPDDSPFRAAAAFYPICLNEPRRLEASLMILHGEDDRETSARSCQTMKLTGSPPHNINLVVYPNTRHAFDMAGGSYYKKDAADDAYARIEAFFAKHLK